MLELLLPSILYALLLSGIYSLMAVGLTLCFGVMRVVNSAQAAFAILGSFIAYWIYTLVGVDPLLVIPLGVAILFCLGAVVYRFVVNWTIGPPLVSLLVTFALGMVIENSMILLWSNQYRSLVTPYSSGAIVFLGVRLPIPLTISFLLSLAIIGALAAFLKFSRLGKAVRGTSMERKAATLMGINVNLIFTLTFAIAIALGGVSGVLMALIYPFYPSLQGSWVALIYLIVVLGGMGSITGTLVASFGIALIQNVIQVFYPSIVAQVVLYAILVVTLILRPQGLLGEKKT